MLKESLPAYLMQRLAAQPITQSPARTLNVATRAGAGALGTQDEACDFEKGKAADLVYLRPPEDSVLAGALRRLKDSDRIVAALFTLAGEESIGEVQVKVHAVIDRRT